MQTLAQKTPTASAKSAAPRRAHPEQGYAANPIHRLQRWMGNQGLQRMLHANAAAASERSSSHPDFGPIPVRGDAPVGVQPTLTINPPGDIHEQEADRVARQVMRMPEPRLQRRCACGGECAACQSTADAHRHVQTRRAPANDLSGTAAPPIVHDVLRSPGRPLESTTRAFMEPRFGQDFGGVRVHTDAAASRNRQPKSMLQAYTVGRDVVFASQRYAPAEFEGKRLLAHELAHVVQQGASAPPVSIQREPEDATDAMDGLNDPAARPPLPTKIKFWMNSFIPASVPGGTRVPTGPHRGKTMFPGPFPWSDCFLSDSRTFSSAINASSRLHLEVEADLSLQTWNFPAPKSSGTAELDCEDNDVECAAVATPTASQMEDIGPGYMLFFFSAAASDPCVTQAPNIDVSGTLIVNTTGRTISLTAMIEPFPDFEAYVSIDGGAPKRLFAISAAAGKSPWNLFGGASVPVNVAVTF